MEELQRSHSAPPGKSIDRLAWLGLIFLGWALILFLRLVDLQVFGHSKYQKLAQSQQDRLEPLEAPRGSVFDRNGSVLAISSASHFVVVNPMRIPNKEIAAALLGRILSLDAVKLEQDLETAGLSKRHHGYLVVDPNVSDYKANTLRSMKLDWLEIRKGSVRTYPNGQLAVHVIGNVDAEGNGAAGIEQKVNKELAGSPGFLRVRVDVKGRPYESEIAKAPLTGRNLGLTIDSEIQHVAEDALKKSVVRNHADHGSLIAMDPRTGEVLALANFPTYNPNERLRAGEKPQGRENFAVVAPFEPGSVFKVVTVSAAMETTSLRPGSIINCGNGVMTLFSRVIHDTHPYPALPVEDVLAKSSNIGAIRIGMQVGTKNLYDYIRRFGFGHRTGIELPAEAPGLVRPLKRWQPTSIGSVPMGHEVSVTSLQLAQLGAVIANGGFLVHPHLVNWKQAPGGTREIMRFAPALQVLRPETVMAMRKMMHRVTLKGGTAQNLKLTGYTFAGKTGTAQIYDFPHHVYTHRYNASFLGFAPMNDPRMVIIVTISGTTGQAGFGGYAAGPVFESVATTALREHGVPRDKPEDIDELEAKAAAKEKKSRNKSAKEKGREDDVAIADLSVPFTEEEMREAVDDSGSQQVADAFVDPNAPKIPDFSGKTVRDVLEEATSNGLEVDMMGEGLARGQSPPPGSLLLPGSHVRVRFAK